MMKTPSTDGSLALELDFGPVAAAGASMEPARDFRLVPGPDKYAVLEHRRRQAQIRARHLLDLMEEN